MGTGLHLLLTLVLCHGLAGKTDVYTAPEGGNVTVRCMIYGDGTTLYFCQNNCDDILVWTSGTKTQQSTGRYAVQYEEGPTPPHVMHVSIRNVVSSDSGSYLCETWAGPVKTDSVLFQIAVTSATTSSAPDLSPRPSGRSRLLWLLLVIPVAVVMTFALVFLTCRKRRTRSGEPRRSRAEIEMYENVGPESAEATYQSLCVDTVDHDQTYSCIRDRAGTQT